MSNRRVRKVLEQREKEQSESDLPSSDSAVTSEGDADSEGESEQPPLAAFSNPFELVTACSNHEFTSHRTGQLDLEEDSNECRAAEPLSAIDAVPAVSRRRRKGRKRRGQSKLKEQSIDEMVREIDEYAICQLETCRSSSKLQLFQINVLQV